MNELWVTRNFMLFYVVLLQKAKFIEYLLNVVKFLFVKRGTAFIFNKVPWESNLGFYFVSLYINFIDFFFLIQ